MYKIGDYVIYLKEVCKVENIKINYMDNKDYYILKPINDTKRNSARTFEFRV